MCKEEEETMKKLVCMLLTLVLALSFVLPAMAEDAIKIGVIGPLTGPYAIYGNAALYGAQIAAEEINALGGLQFVIEGQDDEGDGEKGVNAYNALLDGGTKVILGTVTSGSCIAVSAVAFEERVFMLTPSASADLVIADKDNIFQVCFKDSAQGSASAQYIFDNKLGEKVGIIYNNAIDYSIGICETFKARAAELGMEIVAESAFSDDSNADFSVQVAAMKEAGADVVFLPIYYTPASMILTQAKAVDYAPIFFGVDGMDGILGLEGFDKSLAEGVMLLTPFSADAEDEQTKSFVAKYQELHGEIPNQFAADAYDGMYALYQAMVNTGITAATTPEEACELLIAEFPNLEVAGLTGTMHWDSTGAVNKTPTAVVIQDGVYVGATK